MLRTGVTRLKLLLGLSPTLAVAFMLQAPTPVYAAVCGQDYHWETGASILGNSGVNPWGAYTTLTYQNYNSLCTGFNGTVFSTEWAMVASNDANLCSPSGGVLACGGWQQSGFVKSSGWSGWSCSGSTGEHFAQDADEVNGVTTDVNTIQSLSCAGSGEVHSHREFIWYDSVSKNYFVDAQIDGTSYQDSENYGWSPYQDWANSGSAGEGYQAEWAAEVVFAQSQYTGTSSHRIDFSGDQYQDFNTSSWSSPTSGIMSTFIDASDAPTGSQPPGGQIYYPSSSHQQVWQGGT